MLPEGRLTARETILDLTIDGNHPHLHTRPLWCTCRYREIPKCRMGTDNEWLETQNFVCSQFLLATCYTFRCVGRLEADHFAVSHSLFVDPTMIRMVQQFIRLTEMTWNHDICRNQVSLRDRPDIAQG